MDGEEFHVFKRLINRGRKKDRSADVVELSPANAIHCDVGVASIADSMMTILVLVAVKRVLSSLNPCRPFLN
jgi:hypothetical protein